MSRSTTNGPFVGGRKSAKNFKKMCNKKLRRETKTNINNDIQPTRLKEVSNVYDSPKDGQKGYLGKPRSRSCTQLN